MKALKQEEPKIPHKDSEWLSKTSHPRRSDKKDSVNCLTQESVGLKKSLNKYTHSDIPQLHEEITDKYSDLLGPLPLKLPPFCEVSHEIPLIDESKQLKHRLPRCLEAFHSELTQKIKCYTTTGWWVPAATKQAMPMLCIPKKNIENCVQSVTAEWEYSRQQNHLDVWEFWIVHWIYILIKWLNFWEYSDIY